MPDKPKDSKDGLGASIAGGFDDSDEDQDDARTSGDDTGSKDGNDEDGDGGSDDSKRGKPEGKKDEKDGKKGEGDDDGKVTLTKDELKALVEEASTKAVSAAVASVNSTKDKQLQDERKKGAEERENILRTQEEGRLSGLTGDDRARMQSVIDTDRSKREANQDKADAAEMYRTAKVERSLTSHARFGVTEEQLQKCESEAEMLQICSDAERQYWQDIATGKRRPDDETSQLAQQRHQKKEKPEGSQRKTNIGAGGSGGSDTNKEGQATTLDGFGRGLVEGGVVPGGGIQRETK